MTQQVEQSQMEEILSKERMAPFILIAQARTAKCVKCGHLIPEPGRVTLFDGVESRTWCDCITEEEMQNVVQEFQGLMALYKMNPQRGGVA